MRYNWAAAEYRGKAMVVYGHTPVAEPEWLNRTINIDTGCVFGGKLTALRYPERELISVSALRTYYESAKPFLFCQEQSCHAERYAGYGCRHVYNGRVHVYRLGVWAIFGRKYTLGAVSAGSLTPRGPAC